MIKPIKSDYDPIIVFRCYDRLVAIVLDYLVLGTRDGHTLDTVVLSSVHVRPELVVHLQEYRVVSWHMPSEVGDPLLRTVVRDQVQGFGGERPTAESGVDQHAMR